MLRIMTLLSVFTALSAITGCNVDKNKTNALQEVKNEAEHTNTTESAKEMSLEIILKPHTFDEKFPALAIQITRKGQDEGFLYVRFPEIIEAWVPSTGKSMKFYQDNRIPEWPAVLECEPLTLPVQWQGDKKNLSYTMNFDNGMSLTSNAQVIGTDIVLTHKLHNGTSLDLKELKMWNCVQLTTASNLHDPLMERTHVLVDNTFKLIRQLVPDFEPWPLSESAKPHFFRAFRKDGHRWYEDDDNPHTSPHPGYPDDPSKAITTWQVIPPIDTAIIATVSKDSNWGIATYSNDSENIFTNAVNTCHHADAAIDTCGAGDTATISNRVLLFEGDLSDIVPIITNQ